jgi:hypothetical protein
VRDVRQPLKIGVGNSNVNALATGPGVAGLKLPFFASPDINGFDERCARGFEDETKPSTAGGKFAPICPALASELASDKLY